MFGYIRTVPTELRLREYECYRAYYCGLCRAMGKCTGNCSKLTLSYDFVFLAVVRAWLTGEKPETKRIRCIVHPFSKKTAVVNSEQLTYCADASVLLSYGKCADDLSDEKGFRRLRAKTVKMLLRSGYKKAQKRHPELDKIIRENLEKLTAYEKKADRHSADEPAEIFGEIMRAVFSEGLPDKAKRLAGEFGHKIGKWIYLADACDDYKEDLKRHRFNPFRDLYGDELTKENREAIELSMTEILCSVEPVYLLFDLPPTPELKEIVSNILYLGLPKTEKQVLFPTEKETTQ